MGIAVPILMVIAFAYSYYVYVVEVCLMKVATMSKRIVYLVLYHIGAVNLGVFYFMSMCVETDDVPDVYYFTFAELERINDTNEDNPDLKLMLQSMCLQRRIHNFTRKNGIIRYCLKCKLIKPDRTHHCSTCQRCILKMDHHCPWLYNCVSFGNYKIFILLLIHLCIYCFFYSATTAEYILEFFHSLKELDAREVQYVLLCFAMLVAGIAAFCLFVFHVSLLMNNETTLESMNPNQFAENVTFDLGHCDNFLEVFGYNWCLWCLPFMTTLGDGVQFPVTYLNTNVNNNVGNR